MKIKMRNKIKEKPFLVDPLHYIGWLISTGAVIGLFHLLGVHLVHTPWYRVI